MAESITGEPASASVKIKLSTPSPILGPVQFSISPVPQLKFSSMNPLPLSSLPFPSISPVSHSTGILGLPNSPAFAPSSTLL